MQLVYALEDAPETYSKSIFLAGPTPRTHDILGWRKRALQELSDFGYDGVVFIPEPRNQQWHNEYTSQIDWEVKNRNRADVILFWVPRSINGGMPGFTTNFEFGNDLDSGRIVYGRPKVAQKCDYLDELYRRKYNMEPADTLDQTIEQALSRLGDGAQRTGGETCVPSLIWNTAHFQQWYKNQIAARNRIDDAEVLSVFIPRFKHPSPFVFYFQLWVKVWIESEQRHKKNEFFVARPDISVIAAIHREPNGDHDIILVREFRTTVNNKDGFVLELPGGSSFKPNEDPLEVASAELREETGLSIPSHRFKYLNQKQLCATFSAHKAHLFVVELTTLEFEKASLSAYNKTVYGNIEDSERTMIHVMKLSDLFSDKFEIAELDWSMLGMLSYAVKNL